MLTVVLIQIRRSGGVGIGLDWIGLDWLIECMSGDCGDWCLDEDGELRGPKGVYIFDFCSIYDFMTYEI
jgi:hypothetical protein